MNQLELGFSDDYVILRSGKYEFYYGYENDWKFTVKEYGKIIFEINDSEMLNKYSSKQATINPSETLLAGIGYWLLNK